MGVKGVRRGKEEEDEDEVKGLEEDWEEMGGGEGRGEREGGGVWGRGGILRAFGGWKVGEYNNLHLQLAESWHILEVMHPII